MAKIKTTKEIIAEVLHERIAAAYTRFQGAIRPIYRARSDGHPEKIASCFFIAYGDKYYLATAAHVIDDYKFSELHVAVGKGLKRLEGVAIVSTAPHGRRDLDRYDFALVEIDRDKDEEFKKITFIRRNEFCLAGTIPLGHAYMAVGYPNSKNKKVDRVRRQVRPSVWQYAGTAATDDKFARKLGITGKDHLFIGFDHRRSRDKSGEIVNTLKPVGMSGGPLIDLKIIADLNSLNDPSNVQYCVAGLLTEIHKSDKRMVAVKIATVLASLG
jgi:hypothetical protein